MLRGAKTGGGVWLSLEAGPRSWVTQEAAQWAGFWAEPCTLFEETGEREIEPVHILPGALK